VATKNVTISALVALFNIHNAQTCWLRGLSGTYVFADENGSFPQLESFSVYELDVRQSHLAYYINKHTQKTSLNSTLKQKRKGVKHKTIGVSFAQRKWKTIFF